MTQKQYTHVAEIAAVFKERMSAKYEKGAKEHGGNLWDMTPLQLCDCAIDEAIDQIVYLLTQRALLLK